MSEKLILQAGDFSSFAKLSKFESLQEMDLAIRSWLYNNKHELKLSEEALVRYITQLCARAKGVCAIKHETLAVYLNVSVKTVQRGLKTLIERGLITVYETRSAIKAKTSKGKGNPKGRAHNVYVINPVENIDFENLGKKVEEPASQASETAPGQASDQSVVQSVVSSRSIALNADTPTVEDHKNEPDTMFSYTKLSKRIKDKNISTYADNINVVFEEVDKIGHWIPETFKNKALLLLNTADNVNAAYSIIRKKVLKEKLFAYSLEDVNEFGRLTLNAYYKQERELQQMGKSVEKPLAYVTGIIKEILKEKRNAKIDEEYKAVMMEIYSIPESDDSCPSADQSSHSNPFFYNWLEVRE